MVNHSQSRAPSGTSGPPIGAEPKHDHAGRASATDNESIGSLIQTRRHALGLSQMGLAKLLAEVSGKPGISQGRISDYEHERHIPQFWLAHLGTVLHIPYKELERAASRAYLHRCQHQIRAILLQKGQSHDHEIPANSTL